MSLKFTGTIDILTQKLESLGGDWGHQNNKHVLTMGTGLLNWFPSTGTIQFQGKGVDKERLKNKVPNLLYPDEYESISTINSVEKNNTPLEAGSQKSIAKENSIAGDFLTKGLSSANLVIGIVSAVGTETATVCESLKSQLARFKYSVNDIRVSSLLPDPTEGISEYERIQHYMTKGDNLRNNSEDNSVMSLGVANKISEIRKGNSEEKQAFIVNSLKHPSEVDLLRKIYGDGFYLIGIHTDEARRRTYLTEQKNLTQEQANKLIKIDEDEKIAHGQKTRDTYHLADFFLNCGNNSDYVRNNIKRYVELIFSHPYRNPTFDEFAMFMAFNSSVRSADLSRQVGAIISKDNQILATGANDVPKSGGGQYWAEINPKSGVIEDIEDGKDYMRLEDSNKKTQIEIIDEIATSLVKSKICNQTQLEDIKKTLKKTQISDLTEFGRVVHAEMDALTSCAKSGIETKSTSLHCTTFPCHNCAKHIIASGIERIVYVEPYPKSKALDFHSDAVTLKTETNSSEDKQDGLVRVEPFTGVGPRRFLDLFSMNLGKGSKLKRKDKSGDTLDWSERTAKIRSPLLPISYKEIETEAVRMWNSQNIT